MDAAEAASLLVAGRRLVVCLDGTRNEPETGSTNVARIYDLALKSPQQLVYYDPGVGTMGARGAITGVGKMATRTAGLVLGYGVRENVEQAYRFLMHAYQPGDRVYVFGFSRGAYTARALVGMLRTVGLLRPGADNLIPYALKLYAKSGKKQPTDDEEKTFWAIRSNFTAQFGNPDFPNPFAAKQVRFLGVWDTVKSVGWFNWRAQFQQARWPFTRKVPNVEIGRHALSIDERRRPYLEYRFDRDEARSGERLRELWFAGVHSDVGGQFLDDHRLSDIALKWMVDEAVAAGLLIDPKRYQKLLSIKLGDELPGDVALGKIHANSIGWFVLGLGWHKRRIEPYDKVHPSVRHRIASTAQGPQPYRPSLPEG